MADQDQPREEVLALYGEVMQVVQWWERFLGLLWWQVSRKNPEKAHGDFDTPGSQRELRRLEAAFLRASAQEVRAAVTPHLDEQAAVQLPLLMTERNRLAHRFLLETASEAGAFEPGTVEDLLSLRDRFAASVEAIQQPIMAVAEYKGPVPEHWPELAKRIIERLSGGQPLPRDPEQQ